MVLAEHNRQTTPCYTHCVHAMPVSMPVVTVLLRTDCIFASQTPGTIGGHWRRGHPRMGDGSFGQQQLMRYAWSLLIAGVICLVDSDEE